MKLVYNHSRSVGNVSTVMNIVDNTVFIYDYIEKPYSYYGDEYKNPDSVTSEQFLNTIRNMVGDVTVRINSKGGELSYALSVYQTLRECAGEVTAIVEGYACSCAAWVLLAADNRQITPGGIVMVHNPIIYATINSADSIEKIMPQWNVSRDAIASIISNRTAKSMEDVYSMMDNETFMSATDAIANGFCTSIRDGKASIPAGVRNYLPEPIRNAIPESVLVTEDYSDMLTASTLAISRSVLLRKSF